VDHQEHEAELEEKPYSWPRAIGGLLLLPALFILISGALAWIARSSGIIFDQTAGFALTSSSFVLAAILFLVITGRAKSILSSLRLREFHFYYIPLGVAAAVATYIGATVIGILGTTLISSMGKPEARGANDTTQTIGGLAESHSIFYLGLFIVILAPICEEIFFRGAFLGALAQDTRRKWIQIPAAIIVAIAFGFAHFQGFTGTLADVLAVVTPGLVGVTGIILTLKTKSLYPAIVNHMVYNGFVLLIITGVGS